MLRLYRNANESKRKRNETQTKRNRTKRETTNHFNQNYVLRKFQNKYRIPSARAKWHDIQVVIISSPFVQQHMNVISGNRKWRNTIN